MAAVVKAHKESSYPLVDEDGMLDSPESVHSDDDTILTTKKKPHRKYQNVTKKCGVCYLSRVPPHMDPTKLRQILSQYGDIQRIYLVPEDPTAQMHRKRAGGFRGKQFNEGWVEFTEKRAAKKIANMLNGEQIGGKKRSSFYYDIWNIRYLSKFTWDDLTNETAEKNHIREQKRALEASGAKRERDFYLSKVEQSRALSSIEERINKKRKTGETELSKKEPKVIRHFRQNQPITADTAQKKQKLSKDILAGLLGVGS
ncbi:pre-rRNA-processing protein ESF2 [Dioscorea cayenensis subsp. rotundata]|uniref:Pre-rRNA-processing protein ESF2 n=1 Tax=Dioscorea cayennensis subsp. rotundata TaxID=55577 RepID=A0AB40B9N0_DIOCR|nr:pre-rRNA-processing protein ESF2 [Dioscorea cayenensis subsp. rotundata]